MNVTNSVVSGNSAVSVFVVVVIGSFERATQITDRDRKRLV